MRSTRVKWLSVVACSLLFAGTAIAQKKYDQGASDTEIKLGQTMPYSGPASAYGTIGRVEQAYFKMINDQGGINGRKVELLSYDDAYSPPKTVEQTRKLVESDGVLMTYQGLGTPAQAAIQKYPGTSGIASDSTAVASPPPWPCAQVTSTSSGRYPA